MSSQISGHDTHRITSEYSAGWLDIEAATGLPVCIGSEQTGGIGLTCSFALLSGGSESRGTSGNLTYPGACLSAGPKVRGPVRDQVEMGRRLFIVPVEVGGWDGEFRYSLQPASPAITWSWRLVPRAGAGVIRDVSIEINAALPKPERWICQIPGAPVRPDLRVAELPPELKIENLGGTRGSGGVIALSDDRPATLVVWPRCLTENGITTVSGAEQGIRLVYSTRLAAAPQEGLELNQSGIALDFRPVDWAHVRAEVPGWLEDLGVQTPRDRAPWTTGATIFEAQVGRSIFAGGSWNYEPYPTMADLAADLPRIHSLGFDTIQLMPRQPFPSYNVIDYDDIETTYGNVDDLRAAIAWCHEHSMRFILDILMHGVIDQESIGEAADLVRHSRWADLVKAGPEAIKSLSLSVAEQGDLSWSRHIIDFEQFWRDGSPPVHPLTESEPQWFCRDSSGKIIGVYTKAFDMSNPDWQRYFGAKAAMLVRELHIDGFRFDAPGYNCFPNWSTRTRSRASVQELGALPGFRDLRRMLHRIDPDLMLYTEPNGPLWRRSMDINYNYDETWLPDSLLGLGGDHPPSRVRHARDLARWFANRDATLPGGSVTAHHLDSHDTFWWPLPGLKWRREQIGIDAARALMTALALAGGPFMMFAGGETGMDDAVRQVNRLRSQRPELARGKHEFGLDGLISDHLFVVRHRLESECSVLLVNLSGQPLAEDLSEQLPGQWRDLMSGQTVEHSHIELGAFAAAFWTGVS